MIVCGMVWLPVHVVRDPIGPKQLFRFTCKAEGAPAHSRVPDPGCRRAPLRNPLMPHFQQTRTHPSSHARPFEKNGRCRRGKPLLQKEKIALKKKQGRTAGASVFSR